MTLVFHSGPTKIYQICKPFCRSEQTDSIYIYYLSFRAFFREILRISRGTQKYSKSHDIFRKQARNDKQYIYSESACLDLQNVTHIWYIL